MLGSVLLMLVLLGVAGPAAAQAEHEHMLIGSTAPGGGSVILQYDFTRLTVVEAPTFSSIDPSFAPQLVDDPSVPIYALTEGTAVRVEIVALDDGTSLTVNDATLDRPGDRKKIGDAPVLHNHVTWALDVPSGVIGDFHISFKIVASGPYADSPVYTITITNRPLATTTTTSSSSTSTAPTTSPTTTSTDDVEHDHDDARHGDRRAALLSRAARQGRAGLRGPDARPRRPVRRCRCRREGHLGGVQSRADR